MEYRRGVGVLNRMKTRFRRSLVLLAGLLTGMSAQALETDQFYAWGKPIEDSTQYLNAWAQITIQSALDSRPAGDLKDCESAIDEVQSHLQHSIYQPIEIWIIASELVDRIPRGWEANRDYKSKYLLSKTFTFDYARWLRPSPTLQVNEIRFGSDKLAHFFSEGWWYYKHWRKRQHKQTMEQVQHSMFLFGVGLEQGIQGLKMTGIFSPADLEANYQGFRFYRQLCHADEPLFTEKDGRWYFSRSFDISDYVQPEWDESWNPNIYSPKRWDGIRSTMAGYCPALEGDWVNQQRTLYAGMDSQTLTEKMIRELVTAGELPDPRDYDITAVCDSAGPSQSIDED